MKTLDDSFILSSMNKGMEVKAMRQVGERIYLLGENSGKYYSETYNASSRELLSSYSCHEEKNTSQILYSVGFVISACMPVIMFLSTYAINGKIDKVTRDCFFILETPFVALTAVSLVINLLGTSRRERNLKKYNIYQRKIELLKK